MLYPKLLKLDRRIKLSKGQIKKARELRKLGLSYRKIAKHFKVSKSIILYHLNLEYRQKEKKRIIIRDAKRWANKDFRKKYKIIDKESHFYRFWVNKKYRKWNRLIALKRYYIKIALSRNGKNKLKKLRN